MRVEAVGVQALQCHRINLEDIGVSYPAKRKMNSLAEVASYGFNSTVHGVLEQLPLHHHISRQHVFFNSMVCRKLYRMVLKTTT